MHVVVAGGGSAIGQAVCARYLSDKRWDVTALCRDTLPTLGYMQPLLRVVPNFDCVYDAWNAQLLKDVDLLVTCLGSTDDAKLADMSEAQWRRVIDDNLTGVANLLRYAPSYMRSPGSVVVVGSVVGSTGGYGCANYAAAKAGLVGLVRSAALEWASNGIRVNLLELGYVDAGMGARLDTKTRARALERIPLRRFATLAEVVNAVEWLGRATYCTGAIVPVTGGLR